MRITHLLWTALLLSGCATSPEVKKEASDAKPAITPATLLGSDKTWGNTEGPAVDSKGTLYFTSRGTYKGIVSWNEKQGFQLYLDGCRGNEIQDRLNTEVPNPFVGVAGFEGTAHYANATLQRQQLLRPYPQFTGIGSQRYDGTSNYNAGTVRLEKRFMHGYTLL